MRLDLPGWGAGELMLEARETLFKNGWKQMDNYGDGTGRVDCIEKTFSDVIIGTIWAGRYLMLLPRKVGTKPNDDDGFVLDPEKEVEEAISELKPLIDKIVAAHKKEWDAEIKRYEKKLRASDEKYKNFVYCRSEKYGV